MIASKSQLHSILATVLKERHGQGHDTASAERQLAEAAGSYDAMFALAAQIPHLPMRKGWPYVQPESWEDIVAEMSPWRRVDPIAKVDLADASKRVEAGFYGSVCGCILGKPLEILPTLRELEEAFTRIGEWPIREYVSRRVFDEGKLRERNASWTETCRENIRWVAPDDDINYSILGMMALEQHGIGFTVDQLRWLWLNNLAPLKTWGPERTILVKAAAMTIPETFAPVSEELVAEWTNILNPGDGLCGAQIRADAYGYACPGRPMLAAELAWRDAHLTHRLTGVYAAMFTAAAIAIAMVEPDRLKIFETALQYMPQRSRFAEVVRDAIDEVRNASDWRDGYRRIHASYSEYGHCQVLQETATLINTLRFAKEVGDGICIQVMQGNDTDSYGATAGSLLGCYFGPGHLAARWIEPFHDRIHTTLADFHEQSLSAVARRMAQLPRLTAGDH
jgi:ADP-ribosylglycohydrolase